ncbi:hypothetical protein SAY87_022240 [Trapa incisa]|uniref:HVA22-like protein n=2 Tax=Trapa TaxID=22665 RepID=A0AAN7MFD6_TRANT|nr:hypothetical protein SAY87_022240 [Trapa incisa]KAK4804474.1 hypothetical protein SAY86_004291 [Trapa natans]
MLGSFLTRGLALVFGYAYPAYECYKAVEKNKPEIEQLLFWCQYWILVAAITVCERVGDTFISWIPMYSEAKLAFFIYLWYPKTKGTTYVYDSFFKPYLAKHENEIDRNLLELRTRAGDMAILYWQRAASYSQTRIFEVMQYIAAQSTPRPRPAHPPQQGPRRTGPVPAASDGQPSEKDHIETEEPPSSISSSQDQQEVSKLAGPSNVPKAAPSVSAPIPPKSSTTSSETPAQSAPAEVVSPPLAADKNPDLPQPPPPKETVMEEVVHRTRAKLRKARSIPTRKGTESADP